jgi:CHU_C Type IX secretion signal domain/CUB domain
MKISKTLIVTHIALNRASFEIPIYMFSNRHFNRMKRIFTALISTVLLATTAFAQVPANDNCSGAITLTPTPIGSACPTAIYTNVGANDATGAINSPNPTCFNGLRAFKDVWFKFRTTTGSNVNYRVAIKGINAADSIKNPQIALFVGDCTSGLVEEYCATKDIVRDTNGISIDAGCMRPNTDYYIQVASYLSNDIGGKFTVCVQPIDPIYTMKAQTQTTTACLGTLYDSGGPTNNYGSNENNWTFNIRPQGVGCIEVKIDSFSTEANIDTLTIYDGNTGALLDKISGLTNRPIVFQAPTNWIRVVFKSNATLNARGFKLSWTSSLACSAPPATSCTAPEIIQSLPFSSVNTTNCNDAISTVTTSPCLATANGFLGGKDHVYKFTSAGGQCVNIFLTNIPPFNGGSGTQTGINFGLYRNCPAGAGSECVGTGKLNTNRDSSSLRNISLTIAGDYYLVVSSREACTSYNIKMDTVTCLNNLPSAGFCERAVSINGCRNAVSNLLVDLSQQGDLSFMNFTTPLYSGNRGCINTFGFGTPPPANFTFLTFKAQANGKFGFLINPITLGAVDVDFNVYGPIDNAADICTYAKTNAPARSSYASSFTGPGNNTTGLADSYRTPAGVLVNVTDDIDCNLGNTDGIVRRMDVVKDKFYLIWINDFSGVIGRDGVRLDFSGSGDSVLSSASTAALAGRDTAICIGGSTQLFAQGGIAYKWTPALGLSRDTAARPVATPLVSTVYNVEIQQACQLVAKKVDVLVFNVKDIPNQTVCRNEDLVFNAGEVYPATAGAVWSWTSSTNNIAELSATNIPNPTFRATGAAGDHIFTVTLTTPSCTLSKTVTITVTAQIAPVYSVVTSLTAKRDTNVCSGQPFNLLKIGFDNTAIYTWASAPTTNISGNNPAVAPTSSLKYYVSVTGGVGGCTAVSKDSVIVNVFQAPILNVISDTALCRDLVISLGKTAAQASTTYSWSDRIGFDNPNALNPNLTVRPGVNTYTLTANNIGGCTFSKSVKVTGIDLRMTINGADTVKICRGTPLNLTTTITPANARIKWSSNRDFTTPIDSTTANITVNPITRSRYYADASLGSCRRIDSVDVLVDSLPLNRAILPKDTTVCIGTIVLLRSPVYEPVFYPTLTFKWTPSFGAITPDSFYNIVINADQTRTYSRVATSGACTATDTVRINVNPIPTLVLAPRDTQLCVPAGSVRMTVTTPNQGVTGYKWKVNGADDANGDDKMFLVVNPGLGTTTILVSAKIGDCPSSTSTTIRVNPTPTIDLPKPPATILCTGGTTPLVLNSTPNAAFTYSWTGPGFTSTASAPSVLPTVDNSKYVVTVRSAFGCTKSDSVTLRLAVGTLDSINPVGVCSGTANPSITANGTTTVGAGSYSWSSGEKGATIAPSSSVTGVYTVTYTFGNNCTLSRSVRVNSIPGFSLRINPDSFSKARLIDQGTPITLTANGTGNTGTLSYVWTADGSAAGATQTINFKANGDATYKVSATSSTTCKKDTSISLSIRYPSYRLPNAFTPNTDTINSFFNLIFNGINQPSLTDPRPQFWKGRIEVISFQVFNRWGQEVYGETASAVLNAAAYKGWNGKKGGKDDGTEQASDVYVYLIKLKMPDDTIKVESGELNLIR